MTHTPSPPPPADGRVPGTPGTCPADRHARGPAGLVGRAPDTGPPAEADPTARAAALGRELAAAAGTDGDDVRVLARRLAASLTPETQLVLLDALAEAGASHEQGGPAVHGCLTGHGPGPASAQGSGGVPPCGDHGFPRAPRSEPPPGLVRLRFADACALERAGAAFGARPATGLGVALSDPTTLTLRIPGDASVETVRAVLAVLDTAAVTAESLTVHSRELDDVFAAFTSLP